MLLGALASRAAGAQIVYELTPTAGLGYTDNVNVTGVGNQHSSDAFTLITAAVRARYEGARAGHALGYRLGYTHYLFGQGQDVVSHDLAWLSSLKLSGSLTLRLTATATLSRTSNLAAPGDPSTANNQALLTGTTEFVGLGATEDLAYEATPRRTYGETFTFAEFRPIGGSNSIATTTFLTGAIRAAQALGLNSFTLTASLSDSIVSSTPMNAGNTFETGHTFVGQAFVGWSRDLSPVWSTAVQAGPSIIFKPSGDGVVAPSGSATLNYKRFPWFASVAVMQMPALNLYFGTTTITDQAILRIALPLTRSELLYVGGYGGYAYARFADNQASFTRAYDQVLGGASLVARFARRPFFASLNYTVVSQRGSTLPGQSFSDLAYQAVLLNFAGNFAWGPGTPPLFGGVL